MLKKRKSVDVFRNIFANSSHNSSVNSSSFFFSKRGQVTLFIILGLVILLALILIISLRQEILVFQPEEVAPTGKGRIENYVSACIQKLGEEALFLVGEQGGYVEVPPQVAEEATLHLQLNPLRAVPYWAYGVHSYIPSLAEIKEEIDFYIEDNLRSCLFADKPFQESYDIIEKGELRANTEIVDNKVVFNVQWDLEIRDKAGEIITQIQDYQAESPTKLKKMYEMAKKITEKELETLKLEDLTLDLLALEHPQVPFMGMKLGCTKEEWSVKEVKAQVQELLRLNLKQLKIAGTEYVEFPKELPYYENHYVWDLGEDFNSAEVSVSFDYAPSFPLFFQVTPQENGKLRSGVLGGTQQISFLCVQLWKFVYDLNFPLLVRVHDEESGANFEFAMMVHLVRNLPGRDQQISVVPSQTLTFLDSENYCAQRYLPVKIDTWQLVDNHKSTYYREPLEDVELSFICLKYECAVGKSKFDSSNNLYQAGINANLPQCLGGILRGKKEGYLEDAVMFNPAINKSVELNLRPLVKIPLNKIKVEAHEFYGKEEMPGTAENLPEGTYALVRLIYKVEGQEVRRSEQVVGVITDAEILAEQFLEFYGQGDFTYDLEINLFDGEKIVGGYKGLWTPDSYALAQTRELIFPVLIKSGANEDEQLSIYQNLEEYSLNLGLPVIKS